MRETWDPEERSPIDDEAAIVMVCRRRRPVAVQREFGWHPFTTCVLVPLSSAFYLTLPLFGIAICCKVPGPLLNDPVWGPLIGLWFVGWTISFCWHALAIPTTGLLVLRSDGFRYKGREVKFASVASLHVGRITSRFSEGIYQLNRILGSVSYANDKAARAFEISKTASVIVTPKAGRPWTMKNVLLIHVREDVNCFFDLIAASRPELQLIPCEEPLDQLEEDHAALRDQVLETVAECGPDEVQSKPISARARVALIVILGLFVYVVLDLLGVFKSARR
jgi:hypothetical protein